MEASRPGGSLLWDWGLSQQGRQGVSGQEAKGGRPEMRSHQPSETNSKNATLNLWGRAKRFILICILQTRNWGTEKHLPQETKTKTWRSQNSALPGRSPAASIRTNATDVFQTFHKTDGWAFLEISANTLFGKSIHYWRPFGKYYQNLKWASNFPLGHSTFWNSSYNESESWSVVSDSATQWTIQSMEFSRPEYWSGWLFPSPGDLPNPGIEPRSPALQADSLPAEPSRKPSSYRDTHKDAYIRRFSVALF